MVRKRLTDAELWAHAERERDRRAAAREVADAAARSSDGSSETPRTDAQLRASRIAQGRPAEPQGQRRRRRRPVAQLTLGPEAHAALARVPDRERSRWVESAILARLGMPASDAGQAFEDALCELIRRALECRVREGTCAALAAIGQRLESAGAALAAAWDRVPPE